MHIREATETDRPALLRLLRQIADCASDRYYTPDSSDEDVLAILDDCKIFVIDQDGLIIGMNAIQILDLSEHPKAPYRKMAFIMAFGIDDSERRCGHGSTLFQYMRQYLSNEDVEYLSLNVHATNIAAQEFYKKIGLSIISMSMSQSIKRTS